MKVYELQGLEAKIDWATMPQVRPLGLFATKAGAEAEIDRRISKRDWKMDWETFYIVPKEVK